MTPPYTLPEDAELRARVARLMPRLERELERLVRIPSVAFPGFPTAPLREAAEATAALLRDAGLPRVDLVAVPGSPPLVYGERPPAPGAATVLLYAHYDVQPSGDENAWTEAPFAPLRRDNRLYGRGTADDKSGIILHLGALLALGDTCPLGIKVLIEGEEEVGLGHLESYVVTHPELVTADAIIVADGGNLTLGTPTLTTSLRGLTAVDVTVRTLASPLHSGTFGGAAPDALIALTRIIASLHDDEGNVAVAGLNRIEYTGAPYEEPLYRAHTGVLTDVELIGSGSIAERLYARPSINVIGIDAPRVDGSLNALVPEARARISVRLAPGQDSDAAYEAVVRHIRTVTPWSVAVTIARAGSGEGFLARTDGRAYQAAETALCAAFGRDVVHVGQGGSIPLVAALQRLVPAAEIILWGAEEPECRIHAPDESVDLGELERCTLAETLLLAALAAPPATG